jgi:hypothetical protein
MRSKFCGEPNCQKPKFRRERCKQHYRKWHAQAERDALRDPTYEQSVRELEAHRDRVIREMWPEFSARRIGERLGIAHDVILHRASRLGLSGEGKTSNVWVDLA